jgi:hypothetical protein
MDDVDDNHRAIVVKEIAHINFTHLTWMILSRVEMPNLLKLNLCLYDDDVGNNQITSMGVIRKAVWSKIQELIISKEGVMKWKITSEMPRANHLLFPPNAIT